MSKFGPRKHQPRDDVYVLVSDPLAHDASGIRRLRRARYIRVSNAGARIEN